VSSERLSAAKLWLTATSGGDSPYLSAALYSMPTVLTDQVRTISADDHWRLYVNPDWLDVVEVKELAAHLSHLVWHLLRDHAGRARSMNVGTRESAAWARAADMTVSQTLAASGIPMRELPHPSDSGMRTNLSVEEYFTLIDRMGAAAASDELCDCGSSADGLPRPYQVPEDGTAGIDDVLGDELRKQIAISFEEHMRGRGQSPGEWSRWVSQVLEPKVPWQQVLSASVRRAVAWTHGNTHPTYRRLSRRQAASPQAILPGSQRPLPCVAVVVDTSGSMDDGLLAQAVGEVDGVLQSMGNAVGSVQVYSCDAAAHAAAKVRRARDLKLVGGGGTDLRVGIDLALAGRPRPEILIVLTDGDTPWPAVAPVGCAVVAVIVNRGHQPPTPAWATRVDCDVA
jgi:predicted metal-dependent peptidase